MNYTVLHCGCGDIAKHNPDCPNPIPGVTGTYFMVPCLGCKEHNFVDPEGDCYHINEECPWQPL